MMRKICLLLCCLLLSVSWVKSQDTDYVLKNPKLYFTPSFGYTTGSIKFVDIENPENQNIFWAEQAFAYGFSAQFNERRFWFGVDTEFYTDIKIGYETWQSFWNFYSAYKFLNEEPAFVQAKITAREVYKTNISYVGIGGGDFFMVGLNYNNIPNQREFPQVVNFFGEVNYIFLGEERMLVHPPYLIADYSESVQTRMGVIINLWDRLFFEQDANIYTEPTGWVTMSPFQSDFTTSFWIQLGEFRLKYSHTCYHTFINERDGFPKVQGGMDSFKMQYKFGPK